jgi:hypothetical protein
MANMDGILGNGLLAEQDRQLELQAKIQLYNKKIATWIQNNWPSNTTRQYNA